MKIVKCVGRVIMYAAAGVLAMYCVALGATVVGIVGLAIEGLVR